MKIAICVGHSRPGRTGKPEGGAVGVAGVSEHAYNVQVAAEIAARLEAAGHAAHVVSAYEGNSYGAAIGWLATHLRAERCDAAIELHFNAAARTDARGHEWLYWPTSARGKALAAAIEQVWRQEFPGVPARGIKPRGEGNGSQFLRATHCPAVIAEPFFGSSEADWKAFGRNPQLVGATIARGIIEFLKVK